MLATLEQHKRTWSGFVRDYSEGGLFVTCHAPATLGERVVVWLQRPSDAAVVEIRAIVRRIVQQGESSQRRALEFERGLSTVPALACTDPPIY